MAFFLEEPCSLSLGTFPGFSVTSPQQLPFHCKHENSILGSLRSHSWVTSSIPRAPPTKGWIHPKFSPAQTGPPTYSMSFLGQPRKHKTNLQNDFTDFARSGPFANLTLYQSSPHTPSLLKLQLSQFVFIHSPPRGTQDPW